MTDSTRPFAVLSVGELLADLIGHHVSTSLLDSQDFRRYQGGSPANMAANMARLGGQVALVACVGNDNIGKYLTRQLDDAGVNIDNVTADPLEPSSIVVVSRTAGTPDFVAYRHADCQIKPEQLPDSLSGPDSGVSHNLLCPESAARPGYHYRCGPPCPCGWLSG